MNEQEKEKQAADLLDKYREGECTAEEIALLESWYNHMASSAEGYIDSTVEQAIKKKVWNNINGRRSIIPYYKIAAAAIGFILLIGGALYYNSFRDTKQTLAQIQDIQPGGNKAILTLANGQKIILDTAKNGELVSQQGVTISKSTNGQLVYQATANASQTSSINTLTVPAGGQYQVILPDGSNVYLNATSCLIYPTRFAGNERSVTLSGEAYFEVSKDPRKPFIIKSINVAGSTVPQQLIRVIGTHFNVNCYPEEPIRTTLAEGKIEISQPANPQKTTLKPGDQSIVSSNGIKVHQVNPEDVIGWKNGLFVFNQTPLREVMKQIGRWYDVEIDFSSLPNEPFEGEILRSNTLSQVLKVIERTDNLKFQVEGRKISIKH